MKTVIIYHSQTGFTERYAKWLAEATGADCLTLSAARKTPLDGYETIVFGSWMCAGGISKLGWFREKLARWAGKKRIVFCVGGSPAESPDVPVALRRSLSGAEWEGVHAFYCPGGINYEKMSLPSRAVMKAFAAGVRGKKDKTEAERVMAEMLSASYDLSDRRYLEPILACLRD